MTEEPEDYWGVQDYERMMDEEEVATKCDECGLGFGKHTVWCSEKETETQ